jgi:hypothetical protein
MDIMQKRFGKKDWIELAPDLESVPDMGPNVLHFNILIRHICFIKPENPSPFQTGNTLCVDGIAHSN